MRAFDNIAVSVTDRPVRTLYDQMSDDSGIAILSGPIVKNLPNLPYVDTTGNGSFNSRIPPLALEPGTYWVSVQANMADIFVNEWGWNNRYSVAGKRSAWKNPEDGFGTGCSGWSDEDSCILAGTGDHMFIVKGMVD